MDCTPVLWFPIVLVAVSACGGAPQRPPAPAPAPWVETFVVARPGVVTVALTRPRDADRLKLTFRMTSGFNLTVINRTDDPLRMPARQPSLLLEAQSANGEWQRISRLYEAPTEKGHFLLQPEEMVVFRVDERPQDGKEALLRYRIHGTTPPLVSQEFWGSVPDGAVERASHDALALAGASDETLVALIESEPDVSRPSGFPAEVPERAAAHVITVDEESDLCND